MALAPVAAPAPRSPAAGGGVSAADGVGRGVARAGAGGGGYGGRDQGHAPGRHADAADRAAGEQGRCRCEGERDGGAAGSDAPPMQALADGANKAAADPPELEFRLREGASPIYGLVALPDGKSIVTGSVDGRLRVWDLEAKQVVHSYTASAAVMALALHPDGKTIAAMCDDGSLFTWDIQKGEVIRPFSGYPVFAWGVTFAKKGDLIVTPDRDTQAVVCWDAKTGEHRVLARFPDEKHSLDSIAVSPDGEQVAWSRASTATRRGF